jgi:NAD(P)H dehydrogenase (quinone)
MKHMIVSAHPDASSFTMSVARVYAAELESLGHELVIYDLYRMGFDPALPAHELSGSGPDYRPSPDVARAQDAVRAAEVLTVIYPLWWLSMPAMMKGFIDRVFARGFAYDFRDGALHGLLAGRQAILITLSGAALPLLNREGGWNAVQVLQDTHMFRSTGFDIVEHLHLDQVVPQISKLAADRYLARVAACARQHFPAWREATDWL